MRYKEIAGMLYVPYRAGPRRNPSGLSIVGFRHVANRPRERLCLYYITVYQHCASQDLFEFVLEVVKRFFILRPIYFVLFQEQL